LSGDVGAGRADIRATVDTTSPATETTLPRVFVRSATPLWTVSTTWLGVRTASVRAPTTSSTPPGSGRARHAVRTPSAAVGLPSTRTLPMSTALMPSTRLWWVLVMIAKRSSARPSTR
jgi:hypothetical protein